MNKKITIVLLIGLAIAAAGAVFILTRPALLSMEKIFPSGALMYARLSHVEANWEQWVQSGFWKDIAAIDFPKILEHNKVPAADIQHLQKLQKEAEMFINNPLTRKFLGTEIAFGIYEKDSSALKNPLVPYQGVFATRLGLSLQMAELFASMAHQWSDDVVKTMENYRGFNIVHVHFNKRKLDMQYLRVRDVLLISFFPSNILHQAADVYLSKQGSLFLDSNFSNIYSHSYKDGHGIFYVNVQKILKVIQGQLPEIQKKSLLPVFEAASAFTSYAVSVLPTDFLKTRMLLHFEGEKLNHYWHSLFSCPGTNNASLKFVPYSAIVYNWGGCYDFKEMWSSMQSKDGISNPLNQDIEQWTHRLEKKFKLSVNDVLPILGSQMGWYFSDVDTQGFFPYPRGAVFIKITDHQAAEHLMEKITQNPVAVLQKEDYQQSQIHYISLPLGANTDPGYAFLGDYLLLGTSRESLKSSMDAFYNPNQSLESNYIFKQFNMNTAEPIQGFMFIKIDDVSKSLQEALRWYSKVVSSGIAGAAGYAQEVKEHQKELQEDMVSKKEELALAQKKFKSSQAKLSSSVISAEEKEELQGNIDHLGSDIKLLQEDIHSTSVEEKELQQGLLNYQSQVESSRVWLFNLDELLIPFFKAFGNLHALSMKWYLNASFSEMEMFLK